MIRQTGEDRQEQAFQIAEARPIPGDEKNASPGTTGRLTGHDGMIAEGFADRRIYLLRSGLRANSRRLSRSSTQSIYQQLPSSTTIAMTASPARGSETALARPEQAMNTGT